MQFTFRPSRLQFDAETAPERVGDRWTVRTRDLHVGDNGAIGRQSDPVGGEEGAEIRASDLLLALEQTYDIDWERACRFQEELIALT